MTYVPFWWDNNCIYNIILLFIEYVIFQELNEYFKILENDLLKIIIFLFIKYKILNILFIISIKAKKII